MDIEGLALRLAAAAGTAEGLLRVAASKAEEFADVIEDFMEEVTKPEPVVLSRQEQHEKNVDDVLVILLKHEPDSSSTQWWKEEAGNLKRLIDTYESAVSNDLKNYRKKYYGDEF